MRLKKPIDDRRGKPTGAVRVQFTESLYGHGTRGKTVSITVYDTTVENMRDFLIKKLKEEE